MGIRKDIRTLSQSQAEMDNLIRAFDLIQKLPPTDPDSYFQIAGYHGEPFRGAGYSSPSWWGGYCNHGNILFPTWHRAYLVRLESALQKQVPGVMLPYWNEIDEATLTQGIPDIFLSEQYTYADGTVIANPLYSYTFQKTITDRLQPFPDADYSKPAGLPTRRFPFSSLYGKADIQATDAHNAEQAQGGPAEANKKLNLNVLQWLLNSQYVTSEGNRLNAGVKDKYLKCLEAPNYTVFSNTTSAQAWNDNLDDGSVPVVPLESPHNAIHLAVGGIQIPSQDASSIPGANGDMAENDTAAFDPIFFFHHCFIDRMLWTWQTRHNQTTELVMDPQLAQYPGTNSVDGQNPTPGVSGNVWLSLDSPLAPFVGANGKTITSRDVINICDLNYEYDSLPSPLLSDKPLPPALATKKAPHLRISGVNRAAIQGSFFIAAWAPDPKNGVERLVGAEPVLSRWHVSGCANCQTHLEVRAHLPLVGMTKEQAQQEQFVVRVHTRDDPEGKKGVKGGLGAAPGVGGRRPVFEVRG